MADTNTNIIKCTTVRGFPVEINPESKKFVLRGIPCDIYDQEEFPVAQLMEFVKYGYEFKVRVSNGPCEIIQGYDVEIRFVKDAWEYPDYFTAIVVEDFALRRF